MLQLPMHQQPATPPYEELPLFNEDGQFEFPASMFADSLSSDFAEVALPTPAKSPIRQNGPLLLPRIRSQDQNVDPTPPPKRHRKALSCQYNPPESMYYMGPEFIRRSASPAGVCDLISPISQPATNSNFSSVISSPASSANHSRRASASHVDEVTLGKYGFPTYRQMPTYIPPATFALSTVPGASTFVPPPTFTPRAYSLPAEFQYDGAASTTTLFDYLTGPNPTPALVRQINLSAGRGTGQTHFWWDIRNLRSWASFTTNAMDQIPDLMRLMHIELPDTALPTLAIARTKLQPETEVALHDLCHEFYATKITNALKVAQGQTHMVMRSDKGVFLSNYQDDISILGGARVVGLVKSFDRWNTGMRTEAPHRKVEYLQGLSHLHKHMREHSCRYGFIMTEIELVCVRAGTEDIPHFGFLELAAPIQLNARGADAMTACLALWYLHMLGKKDPLPGQPSWKTEVGGAAALTRQKCLPEKDAWIPQPQLAEKREAKRNRGWVMPSDPLHRRELPKTGRRRTVSAKR